MTQRVKQWETIIELTKQGVPTKIVHESTGASIRTISRTQNRYGVKSIYKRGSGNSRVFRKVGDISTKYCRKLFAHDE